MSMCINKYLIEVFVFHSIFTENFFCMTKLVLISDMMPFILYAGAQEIRFVAKEWYWAHIGRTQYIDYCQKPFCGITVFLFFLFFLLSISVGSWRCFHGCRSDFFIHSPAETTFIWSWSILMAVIYSLCLKKLVALRKM